MTRILQIVKTTDGARWAAWQTRALVQLGFEMHVVLPSLQGEAMPLWRASGAELHVANTSLPLKQPWLWSKLRMQCSEILHRVSPDLIHSHFVTNTLAWRLALGRSHQIPILFQVPGPLHLESSATRWLDVKTAGTNDYWIASSRYTRELYARSRVKRARVFFSYYGIPLRDVQSARSGILRAQLGLSERDVVVGNISYIYPPKYFLGQTIGLKGHEYVIDALAQVCRARTDVTGVLVGGQWDGGSRYRNRLMRRARALVGDRIRFVERVAFGSVNSLWADFDCAVHLPLSENCGGVVEPLAAQVPVVASRTGGLPEVILDKVTGMLVPMRDAKRAAECMLEALERPAQAKQQACLGQALVHHMFDIERTANEIAQIYRHVLERADTPSDFDSARWCAHRNNA